MSDWADKAAAEIWAALSDLKGIRQEMDLIDRDIQSEIIETMAEIIRLACTEQSE